MRTLKKALCMVLAVVMILGLGAFGVSADFTDAESISSDYTEAVDLLNAIGVLEGTAGAFNPEKGLTRAEGATIVSRLLGNSKDGSELAKTAKFDDVAENHWAIGHISYCQHEGIIGGYGDGNFGPNDPLTGYQFAKMLLCALGYDATAEGLVGTGWEVQAQKMAKKLGITGDVTLSSEPIQRQEASQLGFNALTVNQVRYTGGTDITVGDTTIKQGGTIDYINSYLADNFNLAVANNNNGKEGAHGFAANTVVIGVVTENAANKEARAREEKTLLNLLKDDGTVKAGDTLELKFATGIDELGAVVKVMKDTKGNVLTCDVISTSVVVDTDIDSAANLKKAFGSTLPEADGNILNIATLDDIYNGTDTADAGTYTLYKNKVVAGVKAPTVTLDYVTGISTTSGSETITFANDGAALTLNNNSTEDVINEYDGIAKKDVVVLVNLDEMYTASKAETVVGKVTEVNANAGTETITVNGTKYTYNETTYDKTNNNIATEVAINAVGFTAEYTLYLVNEKTVALIAGEAASSESPDLYYVTVVYDKAEATEYGDKNYTYAQTVAMDGTEGKMLVGIDAENDDTVAAETGFNANATNCITAGLYSFRASTDEDAKAAGIMVPVAAAANWADEYTETNVETATGPEYKKTIASSTFTKTATKVDGVYVNADTVYLFIKDNKADLKVEVVKGGINMTTGATAIVSKDKDGNEVAKYVIIADKYTDAGTDTNELIFLAAAQTTPNKNANGYVFNVYNAATGEAMEITATNDKLENVGFHKFTVKDGVYTVTAAAEVNASANANGVHGSGSDAEAYTGKMGTAIRSTTLTNDTEAKDAKIVDVRTADQKTDSGVDTITDIDGIAAAHANSKTVKFYTIKSDAGLSVIFITDPKS